MAFNFMQGLEGAGSGALAGSSLGPLGALAGGLFGGLSGFHSNPRKAVGMQPLNNIPGTISPYYKPYIDAGNWATPQLQQQFGNLVNDPNAIISRLGAGYQKSPGYDWRLNQGEQEINNANAAGGMLGTNQHQQQAGDLAGHLADQDYQDYLNHGLSLYGTGLEGLHGMSQQGLTASSDLATSLANVLLGKSNLQYSSAHNDNQQQGGLLGNLISLLSSKAQPQNSTVPQYAQDAMASKWGNSWQ